MKLDVTCMRFLTKDDYRVLVAVEMGMRNHELVPVELITSIAKLRHGGSHKILSTLLRYKLVAHANCEYNGYRLSYMGFDILALRALLGRGVIASVGRQIGVGKESDIFEAMDENGNEVVLKFHRLGRTSFRAVRRQRDYMQGKNKASWLYMSRLAAIKEYAFMKALHANGFPTPVPIDQSRHVVAMSKVPGFPMAQIKAGRMEWAEEVFAISLGILRRLAEHGLVHCDFNEFNLMVDETGHVTLIDFPQMISTSHLNAHEMFARDLQGLVKFFAMKMRYIPPDDMLCKLSDIVVSASDRIDEAVRASGFSEGDDDLLMRFIVDSQQNEGEGDDEGDDGENDGEGEGEGEGNVAGNGEAGATSNGSSSGSSSSSSCSLVPLRPLDAEEAVGSDDDDDDDDDEGSLTDSDDGGDGRGHRGGGKGPETVFDLKRVQERTKRWVHAWLRLSIVYHFHPFYTRCYVHHLLNDSDIVRRKGGHTKGGSRNMTKKRTKYGKIDKGAGKIPADW